MAVVLAPASLRRDLASDNATMKNLTTLLAGLALSLHPAFASEEAEPRRFSLDSVATISYGKVTHTHFTANPGLINYSEDLTLYHAFGESWRVGLGVEFRIVTQQTSVHSTVGNFKGTRWNLYPSVSYQAGDYNLALSPIFLGRYSLSKRTAGGLKLSYTDPIGARLIVSRELTDLGPFRLGAAILLDYVAF